MLKDNTTEIMTFLSEKILPEKIKNIIWNKEIDLIGIICPNYFEIHRIGTKHEVIYSKEELVGISDMIFIPQSDLIAIILRDSNFYFLNIATSEVVVKTKLPSLKGLAPVFNRNEIIMARNLNLYTTTANVKYKNPFTKDLNFISFSKIDVSLIHLFQNRIENSFNYIFNTNTKEVSFYLNLLIPVAKFQLKEKRIFYLDNLNTTDIIYLASGDKDSEEWMLNTVSLENIFKDNFSVDVIHELTYSMHMIDYINQILSIFNKIIYKLSISLFDKYTFANKLEHLIDVDNESMFKMKFARELKDLFTLGNVSDGLKELFKDLFEARTLLKMDENIFFNFKNIEDIITDNVKPALNSILFNVNKLKCLEEKYSLIKELETKYSSLVIQFENFFCQVVETKLGYRNFLAWMNSFNIQAQQVSQNTDTIKNHLTNYLIDYKTLFRFIDSQEYNMAELMRIMEKDTIDLLEGSMDVLNDSNNSFLMKNDLLKGFIQQNNLEDLCLLALSDKVGTFDKTINDNSCLKTRLGEVKERLNLVKNSMITYLSSLIFTKPLMRLRNINNYEVGKIETREGTGLILIKLKSRENSIEYILLIKILSNKPTYLLLQVTNNSSLNLIDYVLDVSENLYLLIMTNSTMSISRTNLSHYTFSDIDNINDSNNYYCKFDLLDLKSVPVKLQSSLNIENSDNINLNYCNKSMMSIVDNRRNKVSIINI
jgi:hypothetical protein